MEIWKVVKTRKSHICNACGEEIKKGEIALRHSILSSAYQRYPNIYYYHYLPDFDVDSVKSWSVGEFRYYICRAFWG